ncbi:MAG: hypothetical protein HN403_06995 [Rhodospirillales bacterium]|nr:hypothetical protein [Rhodospirillales bacterium]
MPCLTQDDVDAARQSLGDADAVLVPYMRKDSGRTEEILLVSDAAAEILAATLGKFGGTMAVKIFASVVSTELCERDIATLIGGEESEIRDEVDRLASSGFLFKQEIDGMIFFGAGNPPLRRFFLNRFAALKIGPDKAGA